MVALAVTVWRIEESRSPQPGRPDWAGFALFTAGLVSLVYGLIRAGETAVGGALRSSFAYALNELLYVTAGLALVGAVCAIVLIRRRDFHRPDGAGEAATGSPDRTPAQKAA